MRSGDESVRPDHRAILAETANHKGHEGPRRKRSAPAGVYFHSLDGGVQRHGLRWGYGVLKGGSTGSSGLHKTAVSENFHKKIRDWRGDQEKS
jgi:hypothetical protein